MRKLNKLIRRFDHLPEDDKRFKSTVFCVEADSFARYALWKEQKEHNKTVRWEQDSIGISPRIGEYAGYPIALEICWVKINGRLVLFYEQCSQFQFHPLSEEWLKLRCDPKWDNGTRSAFTDANNFHHVLHHIRDLNLRSNY